MKVVKNNFKIFFVILTIVGIAVIITMYIYSCGWPKAELAYSQEYVAGTGNIKGDVDVKYYESHGEEFAIGANRQGYAVFKDPRAAMNCICKDLPPSMQRRAAL